MNNINYDFKNIGYKIHLPVLPDVNDPLTNQIVTYLDNIFGTSASDRKGIGSQGFYSTCYKVGNCSDALSQGKGITIYGKNSTADEMQVLAKDLEAKFGKELAQNITKYNINPTKADKPLTTNITTRFAGYHFGTKQANASIQRTFFDYDFISNPSGALTKRTFTDSKGTVQQTKSKIFANNNKMPVLDKKFLYGDSTLTSIDNFGELFTGKIQNGKVPQFIMDGLPPEYLKHYNLTEKDIIKRINNGTKQIVANMLEDVANNGSKSSLLRCGAEPWFTTLDPKVIDDAKHMLAQYEPQTVQKLEQILPQLEKSCPALAVMKQTTPFSKMKIQPVQNPTANTPKPPAPQKPNPTNPVQTPVKPANTNPAVQQTSQNSKGWLKNMSKEGKIGLAIAGAAITAGAIYALIAHNEAKKQTNPIDTKDVNLPLSNNQENKTSFEAKIAQKPSPYMSNYDNMKI